MSYFQQNQSVLRNRFAHVANKMNNIQSRGNGEFSFLEPLEKDKAWLEAVKGSVEDLNMIFVYGFGQGVGIADLVEMYPDRLLFVYEPDEQLFYEGLHKLDLGPILEHPNVYFLSVGESQLNLLFYAVCTQMTTELAFVALRYYLEREIDSLQQLKQDFIKYSDMFDTNRRAQNRYRKDWIRNSMYQMAGMMSSPSIREFYQAYEKSTAIIIASGPSLQDDIEWVKRMKPHALIIAAGSSVQALIKNGIQPHLVALLDGGEINNKVFSNPDTLAAPLIYTSSAYYGIADKKGQDKIHAILHSDEVSQYYMGIDQNQTEIIPTSTVTGTAIQAAVWLGAKRIVMMGQDLSFPNNKYYADGVAHMDANNANKTVQASPYSVLNVQGTYNTTTSSFLIMKDSLENVVANLPEIEFFNATRNGAVIEGADWKLAEEVYELISGERIPDDAIRRLLESKNNSRDMEYIEKVKSRVSSTLLELPEIVQEFRKLNKLFGKIREYSRTNPAKCQRMIAEIERMWGGIVNRGWFAPVFEALLPVELGEFDKQLPSIILESRPIQKSNLITGILGALMTNIEAEVPFLQAIFEEALRRIEGLSARV